jgi:hypothetical protein
MSVISHLVWHDVRALRLPLAAWLLVLLAQAAVMAFGPGLIDPETPGEGIVMVAGFLAIARLAFTMLLSVLLVQRDSPVGTTAFWLTRPIRPAVMAASKACSAFLLLVLLPAAVSWSLFTALGVPRADVAAGTGWAALEQVMIVALSAMGAVITATIPQFAVAAVVGALLIGGAMNELRPMLAAVPRIPSLIMYANVLAWVLVTALGALGVTVYQYARRRAFRAGAAVAAVLLLGVLSVFVVQGSGEPQPAVPLKTGVVDPLAVTAGVESMWSDAGITRNARGQDVRYRSATAFLQTTGEPPAVILEPSGIESTWTPTGAAPVRWQRRNPAYRTIDDRPNDGSGQPNRSIAIGLGDVNLINQRGSNTLAFKTTLLSLREEEVSGLPVAQGPLDAMLTLRAWRYRVDESAPLAIGSTVSARQGRLSVHAITPTSDGVIVDLQRAFLERMQITSDAALARALGSSEYLVLRNQARRQAMLASGETGRRLRHSLLDWFLFSRFGTGTLRLHYLLPRGDGSRAALDEEWLKGAELVVLRPEDLGAFTRPVRVEWVNLDNVK